MAQLVIDENKAFIKRYEKLERTNTTTTHGTYTSHKNR